MRYTRSVLEGFDDNGKPFRIEQDEAELNRLLPTAWIRASVDRYVKRLLDVRVMVSGN